MVSIKKAIRALCANLRKSDAVVNEIGRNPPIKCWSDWNEIGEALLEGNNTSVKRIVFLFNIPVDNDTQIDALLRWINNQHCSKSTGLDLDSLNWPVGLVVALQRTSLVSQMPTSPSGANRLSFNVIPDDPFPVDPVSHAVVGCSHINSTAKVALILVRLAFQKFHGRRPSLAELHYQLYWSLFIGIYRALLGFKPDGDPVLLCTQVKLWEEFIVKGRGEYAEVTEQGVSKRLFPADQKGLFLAFLVSYPNKKLDYVDRNTELKSEDFGYEDGDVHTWFGQSDRNSDHSEKERFFDLILTCPKKCKKAKRVLIHGVPSSFVSGNGRKSAPPTAYSEYTLEGAAGLTTQTDRQLTPPNGQKSVQPAAYSPEGAAGLMEPTMLTPGAGQADSLTLGDVTDGNDHFFKHESTPLDSDVWGLGFSRTLGFVYTTRKGKQRSTSRLVNSLDFSTSMRDIVEEITQDNGPTQKVFGLGPNHKEKMDKGKLFRRYKHEVCGAIDEPEFFKMKVSDVCDLIPGKLIRFEISYEEAVTESDLSDDDS